MYKLISLRYNISRVMKMSTERVKKMLKNIGVNLYLVRKKEMHKTQEEFAELTGISKDTISKIERGAVLPSLSSMMEISVVTNKSIDFFLSESSETE